MKRIAVFCYLSTDRRCCTGRRYHPTRGFSSFHFLIVLLLAASPLAAQQDKPTLAVLDLEGRGISQMEAGSLTDRLRTALVRTRDVTVVERGQMERIMQEQDFQMTGCTSDECAVEVGQLLGVTTMVAGSIGKVGATYSIDLRTIDVGSGQITHSMFRDYRGEIDGLLGIMPEVAQELVAAVTAAKPPPEPVPEPATVTIDSDPAGATIVLNGVEAGTTPLTQTEIDPDRRHTLSISLAGYQPVDTTLFAEAGQSYKLDLSLVRLMSRLTIRSQPAGALVFMDRQRIGPTPATLPAVRPDVEHTLALRLTGYQPVDTTFSARAGEHHQINMVLEPVRQVSTAAQQPIPPPETAQPTMKKAQASGGMGWIMVLLLTGAGGYYGYTQGWFGGGEPTNGGESPTVGQPPGAPAP